MTKKFRNRKLPPDEVARDEEVRRKVQEESPPARPTHSTSPQSLSEVLKQAIRDSGQSEYQIAKTAGVSQTVTSPFLSGERDIRMATADKLAKALGLKLGADTWKWQTNSSVTGSAWSPRILLSCRS